MIERLLPIALVLCCKAVPFNSTKLLEGVKEATYTFGPSEIKLESGNLVIRTTAPQVLMKQFALMVVSTCLVMEAEAAPVKELRIFNQHQGQGMAFMAPSKNCERVIHAPAGKLEPYVAMSTHALH